MTGTQRGQAVEDGMDHADELVGRPVVGEEVDSAGAGRPPLTAVGTARTQGRRHATARRPAGQRPSWRERSVAAATASMNADRTALNSRVRTAAAVVPPGRGHRGPSSPGSSPVSAIIRAEPSRVPTTSCRLTSRDRPAMTPASIMASATRKT